VIVVVGVMSAFVVLGDVAMVARIATFSTLISFGLVNVSLVFVLRREASNWRGAFRRPVGLLQPILGVAACGWLAVDVGGTAAAAGLILTALGLGLGAVIEHSRGRREDRTPALA
jgi:amino acid transporter